MRVNVYAEEMTNKIEIISKTVNDKTFTGCRFYLELPVTTKNLQQIQGPFMHGPDDNDSAVTFWGKKDLRLFLKTALVKLNDHYRSKEVDSSETIFQDIEDKKHEYTHRFKELPDIVYLGIIQDQKLNSQPNDRIKYDVNGTAYIFNMEIVPVDHMSYLSCGHYNKKIPIDSLS